MSVRGQQVHVPVLGYTQQSNDPSDGFVIGTSGLTLDGAPFPWPTVGEWVLRFPDDGLATLTIDIVVTLPRDPATLARPDDRPDQTLIADHGNHDKPNPNCPTCQQEIAADVAALGRVR